MDEEETMTTTRRRVTGQLIPDAKRQEVIRLVEEGQLSGNEIAERVGVSRGKTQEIINTWKAVQQARHGQAPEAKTEEVLLGYIDLSGKTQARMHLDRETLDEYAERLLAGDRFPPVDLYYDGQRYHIADGHHRCHAAKKVGRTTITAIVRFGGRREALLHACSANATNGLRRSNADKRRSVFLLLQDEWWQTWSDGEIARHCGVSQPFVSKLRRERSQNGYEEYYEVDESRLVRRGRSTYAMDISRIGSCATPTTGQAPEVPQVTLPPTPGEAVDAPIDDEEVELPAFLCGDDWSPRERRHAYARYRALPADLQPTVAALLNQYGICVPDCCTMLEHITTMDETQRQELVRLQTSADAYERSCAITFALDRPPPPHPCVMLLYDVRRELADQSRRLAGAAARYPDLPGVAEVTAFGARLAAVAHDADALIDTLPRRTAGAAPAEEPPHGV
jgi:transposase-like protein